jgi:geranylgeranyl transferase type-2 subunit beta
MTTPYLVQLTNRLLEGVEQLPTADKHRHAAFVLAQQQPDGGFAGRLGGSDLYYTGFALRSLALLQMLTPELCQRVGGYLLACRGQQTGIADFFSFLYASLLSQLGGGPDVFADSAPDWRQRVAHTLETFRAPDGGYRQHVDGASGSTYNSFLVALCLQTLDLPLVEPQRLADFVRSRRRDDGGFVEIAPMRRSGTNPTAAGVGLLQITDQLDDTTRTGVAAFLAELPSPLEGGFRANGRIPAADLLSTFTGLWTLDQLASLDRVDVRAAAEYAQQLAQPAGGFVGGLWDTQADVEYTFYGLGVAGVAALHGILTEK